MIAQKYAVARRQMVLSQLRPNRITDDRIADAMDIVPREEFVPEALRGVAYLDEDLEVAPGRYLIEPRVFARLLQDAAVTPDDVVLDIGCGTGYSAAVLGRLAAAVVAVESDPALVAAASETLARLDVGNVAVVEGPLAEGNAKQGPYNVIHINGALNTVPESLLEQLAEGGRLICVLGTNPGVATLYQRIEGRFYPRPLFDAAVPPLAELMRGTRFEF
ncbi:protein-L-isoaspartate O-methyltransferase family protein [Sneathiella sp.]|uniref:protein-L-isoaspartate O-methyltransferase family protein n=1 Tax=Sneathiella sp. TaxID=1964365 RepID=UPI002FDFD629